MEQQVTVSAGTAFKIGFFGFFGVLCAYLVIVVVALIPFLLLGGAALFSRNF